MAFTSAQLATGAFYTLETHRKNDPIDQVNQDRPYLDYLLKNKEDTVFGNGHYNENVYKSNDSNYQNYSGADQVTYNERDPVRQARWTNYSAFDGFWFDEDRLLANGIDIDDSSDGVPSKLEADRLTDLLKISYTALKEGFHENFTLESLRNGAQSTKAVAGLDHLVAIDPTVGTLGGLNRATATYFRNNVLTGVVAATVVDKMELMWRACKRYGGQAPTHIFCGEAFLDNFRTQASAAVNRQIVINEKGGTGLDPSVSGVYFKGIPLVHDYAFEDLDVIDAAATPDWTKRCYFLHKSTGPKLRPMKGLWMRNGKPEKLPDRFVTYFGTRSKYGMSTNKPRGQALIAIA